MNAFFSVFGKLVVILIVIGFLVGGGIYVGLKLKGQVDSQNVLHLATPSPSTEVTPAPTAIPNVVSVTSPGGSFVSFKITVPSGWTVDSSQIAGAPKLTVTNGNYQLIISQGAGGGAACLYPGDPPQDFGSPFNAFVTITGTEGEFRRATSQAGSPTGTSVYTVCDKKPFGFGLPTQFGYTTYNTPANPDPTILVILDGMISSLKKQ
jgi:hypothetical protein